MKWQDRIQRQPELRDLAEWPPVLLENIPAAKRKCFLRNQRIASKVLAGESYNRIAQLENVSVSWISKLMTRCLGGPSSHEPLLFQALIPYGYVKIPKRRSPISSIQSPAGHRCSFQYLLEHVPGLQAGLDKCLRAWLNDSERKQNLRPRWFFSEFLRLLGEAQWPTSEYPYTEARLGYSSVYRYFVSRQKALRQARRDRKKKKRILNPISSRNRVMEELQFDWQVYDQFSSAYITDGDLVVPIRISRVSLLALVEAESEAVLSYLLAFTRSPTQDDILGCLQFMHQTWKPIKFTTPGIKYCEGAGFPCGVIAGANRLIPGRIRVDNAWSNDAGSVRAHVTENIFGSYNAGLKRRPLDRRMIEHIFNLTIDHSHRPSTTTGSHVKDPDRQSLKNSKKIPIISLTVLEECVEAFLATYNATPKSSLLGNTPLEIFEGQCRRHYLPRIPNQIGSVANPFEARCKLFVRQNARENRWPHANFIHVKYTGTCLDEELVGKQIEVRFDRRDIRTLRAYTLNGKNLGELKCAKKWSRYPHSLTIRKSIISWLKIEKRKVEDPLVGFYSFMLSRKRTAKNNLELIRLHRHFSGHETKQPAPKTSELDKTSHKEKDNVTGKIKTDDDHEFSAWTPELSGIKYEHDDE